METTEPTTCYKRSVNFRYGFHTVRLGFGSLNVSSEMILWCAVWQVLKSWCTAWHMQQECVDIIRSFQYIYFKSFFSKFRIHLKELKKICHCCAWTNKYSRDDRLCKRSNCEQPSSGLLHREWWKFLTDLSEQRVGPSSWVKNHRLLLDLRQKLSGIDTKIYRH